MRLPGARASIILRDRPLPGHTTTVITHLIHVGYAKTGSTFLKRWFDAHPQIGYFEGGILGFRDVYDLVAKSAAGVSDLRLLVTSSEVLTSPRADGSRRTVDYEKLGATDVEAAPLRASAALHQIFPDARILIVTRGVRSMILSAFSQYVRTSGALDFDGFVVAAARHRPWDYDALIEAYVARFGAANVIVLPFELLREDPTAFTRRLEERVGLDHHPVPAVPVNRSLSGHELYWYPRLRRRIAQLPVGSRLRRALAARYVDALIAGRLG